MSIATCTISASFSNLAPAVPNSPTLQAYLLVKSGGSFFHGTTLVGPFEQRAAFDPTAGTVSVVVIETTTPGKKLEFSVVYTDGIRKKVIRFKPAIVPNQSTANLSDLTEVDQYSTF